MPILQPGMLRKHAVPIGEHRGAGPLVKSTVNLGWMVEHRKVRVPIDTDFPQGRRKDFMFKAARQFIEEERKRDGAKCYTRTVRIHGPFPHFEAQVSGVQKGDDGATRPIARNVREDTSDNGKQDYVIEADFLAPEYITEIPTNLATQLFTQPGGRPGLMPLREKDWRGLATGASRSINR